MDQQQLEQIFIDHKFDKFQWIDPVDIVVAQWVRMKCTYGCSSYGKKGTCPPEVPTIAECRQFFSEYTKAVIFHIPQKLDDPKKRDKFSKKTNNRLLKVERDVFLAGNRKAFLLFMDECQVCAECPGTKHECKNAEMARPCPESLGVDVFGTVRKYGFPIEVLTDYDQEMNRYAFLMVE